MNRELALKVANAVLYEGYMLYPYRPSAIKNRQRWSFGILYPAAYDEVAAATERSHMHSECLARLTGDAAFQIQLRFLHLVTHEVLRKTDEGFEPVPSLVIDGKLVEPWEEGTERSVQFEIPLSEIWVPRSSHRLAGAGQLTPTQKTAPPWPNDGQNEAPQVHKFSFCSLRGTEQLHGEGGENVGEVVRKQQEITGTVAVAASPMRDNVFKLMIDVSNTSPLHGDPQDRGSALLTSLLSAHTILSISGGEFISLLDPPEDLRDAVSECHNVGNFPVLVGAEGERDMMLCSPIVLYDHPQIAPESAGDFFDGTEMDEMLTLRVMTLTDDEKDAMRMGNDHVRNLLQRTEASAREQLQRTHGTIRSMRPVEEP